MSNTHTFVDELLSKLRSAVLCESPEAEVKSVLQHVVSNPVQLQQDLPVFPDNDTILFEDDSLSVWHCRFDPGYTVPAHDHQLSATIGIYSGAEKNTLYRHCSDGSLIVDREVTLMPGDILQIQPDEIHAVSCAGQTSCYGIHVYLGSLTTVKRSLFDTVSGEVFCFSDDNYHRLTRAQSTGLLK